MKKLAIVTALWLFALLSWPAGAQLEFGPDQEARGNQLDSIVAIVNDDVISRVELETAMAATRRQIQQSGTPLPPEEVLERQVLERLILGKLQLRAAERNGIVVDDPTLNAAIESLARRNNLTLSQLRETLQRDGFDFAKFREDMRQELMATRLRQRVVDSRIQISEQEVDNLMQSPAASSASPNDGAQQYHIAHILVAMPEGASPEQTETARNQALEILEQLRQGADFARLAVAVSDGRQALEGGDLGWRTKDQLPTLFTEAVPRLQAGQVSDLIRSPSGFHIVKLLEIKGSSSQQQLITQTRARHILISPDELISSEAARQQLQRLRQRIQDGEDFGDLARAHSTDTASAVRGGDLGWINPGDVVPAFEREMARLAPGDISEPFESPFGWHIVQVLERRQQEGTGELQRAQVREALFRRRVEEEWELWLRQLRDEAYVEIRL